MIGSRSSVPNPTLATIVWGRNGCEKHFDLYSFARTSVVRQKSCNVVAGGG